MLKEYHNEFGRMYEEILNGENPSKVIRENSLSQKGIDRETILYYFGKYLRKNSTK